MWKSTKLANVVDHPAGPRTHRYPRVLVIGDYPSRWGLNESVSEELAFRLKSAGWRVETTDFGGGRTRRLLGRVFTVINRASHYDVAYVDVFSGLAFGLAEVSCAALRLVRKPYVLTLHGGNLPAFAARWPRRVRALLTSARVVTSPSGYLQKALMQFRPDIHVIPNALDLASYKCAERDQLKPKCLWLRAFGSTYNPLMAIRAFESIKKSYLSATLTMIGPDLHDGTLELCVEAASGSQYRAAIEIRRGVPRSAVPEIVADHDIFLNTANIDNTPVSVLEAMAGGMCVVTTDVGGIRQIASNGVNALIVPARDHEAMASAVKRLLASPDLAARISRAAQLNCRHFDWPSVLDEWRAVIEHAARYVRSE